MSNKLELTWVGKNERTRLEPRILIPDDTKSVVAPKRVSSKDIFDNQLIFGDNLLALKALELDYAGKVKCVFIDPPYNTRTAFPEYNDGIEHSYWLSLLRDRISIIRNLLSNDGSLWISIDDNEAHYLKIMCDEIFGRDCFVASFIWRKVDSPNDNKVPITPDHEYILAYTRIKDGVKFKPKFDEAILNAYNEPDEHSDKPYRDRLLKKNGKNSLRADRPTMYFPIIDPDGNELLPLHDDGAEAVWAKGVKSVQELISKNELIWKKRVSNGTERWVPYTREYAPQTPTRPYPTIWNDLDTTRQTKGHQKEVLGSKVVPFSTPKPENLLQRILSMCTEPGDLVLDSFAGSGTTGAVAHKMGRRWIMVEMGDHCHTHIIPRLQKVIGGEDQGGITKDASWKGGGGFRYFRIAKSLMKKDRFGQWVINRDEYNAEKLAEAVCKMEGFKYDPSSEVYWQHGHSTENDFIYVTTQSMTNEHFASLSHDIGEGRSLLIICGSYDGSPERFKNLTVKVLRRELVGKYEWGREAYALNVQAVQDQDEDEDDDNAEDCGSKGCCEEPKVIELPKKGRGRPAKAKSSDANQRITFGDQP